MKKTCCGSNNTKLLLVFISLLLQVACATTPAAPPEVLAPETDSIMADLAARQEMQKKELFQRERLIADSLYSAKNAYDDDYLMTPAGSNAYDLYHEVLMIDPGNSVAISGLQEILQRYIELADSSMQAGRYKNSQLMLERASRVDRTNVEIQSARLRLESARLVQVNFFVLDGEDLTQQNIEILVQLAGIGLYIKDQDATFLITSRNDAEGRWIYKVMRTAAGGERLRGDIKLGNSPGIQVNISKQERT